MVPCALYMLFDLLRCLLRWVTCYREFGNTSKIFVIFMNYPHYIHSNSLLMLSILHASLRTGKQPVLMMEWLQCFIGYEIVSVDPQRTTVRQMDWAPIPNPFGCHIVNYSCLLSRSEEVAELTCMNIRYCLIVDPLHSICFVWKDVHNCADWPLVHHFM